jgi:hypothetical protein
MPRLVNQVMVVEFKVLVKALLGKVRAAERVGGALVL